VPPSARRPRRRSRTLSLNNSAETLSWIVSNFFRIGPDVLEENLLAVVVRADRFGLEVDIHLAREAVGHHEGRTGEVVRADLRVDARLEVAISGEDARRPQVVLVDSGLDRFRERTRVADTGRTAVADDVVAQSLEVVEQVGLFEVLGNDLAAGCEAGLDVLGDVESPCSSALRASSPAATITDGFEVFVQLVIALTTRTEPWPISTSVPSSSVTGTFSSRPGWSVATSPPSPPLHRCR